MKFALFLVTAFAMTALAQEPSVSPPVHLESISTEAARGEVRIDIKTSAPVEASGSVVVRDHSLILDLPGVAYEQSVKRLVVNRDGIRDVLVSVLPEGAPSTRITVTMSRAQPYILSSDGVMISLRLGPAVAKARQRQQRGGPIPTARAGAIDRIFRRPPRQPVYEAPRPALVAAQNEPAPTPLPPIRVPDAAAPGQPAATSAPKTPDSKPEVAAGSEKDTSVLVSAAPAAARLLQPLPLAEVAPPELMAVDDARLPSMQPLGTGVESPVAGTPAGEVEARTAPAAANPDLRTSFHVKFVQQDAAYIDAGRNEGLAEGMKLLVVNADSSGALPNNTSQTAAVAELTIVGIAETSAVAQIHVLQRDVVPGDLAFLSDSDLQALVQQHSLSSTRKYPAVISFTEDDDALDEEARELDVPRPPLPSVNRMQGRIGFDYFGTHSLDASQANGRDLGVVLRADFTRIGGTYWNFLGYYRGTIDSTSAASQATLQELINRTYHLGLTYDNPTGHWVAGFGRLYLPWASSLDTIDGGYVGRRFGSGIIAGMFAGSTPDPTSWNYNPNRQIGGAFVNFSGGSFDALHYSSTSGAGISLLSWAVDRPFLFFENSVSYRRSFSIYSALQADSPAGNSAVVAPGPGIGSSLFTMRWSPVQRVQLDFNHTYFRDVPTFDPALVGTGLLDKYLFQGFSGGARVDIVKQIAIYTELGRSNRTGDARMALNDMYGITFGRVPWIELRADAHYSRFNSSFGSGSYRAVSLSRNISEGLRLEILAGDQAFTSTLAGNQSARFVTTTAENDLGSYLFTQAGFTVYRGQQQNYNQWMLMLGYRFDSKWKHK
jgi:AMIN domain